MGNYLLYTNVCISLLNKDGGIIQHVLDVGQDHCYISEITVAELYYGAAKSGRKSHIQDVKTITRLFGIVPILPHLKLYGEIRFALEKKGTRRDDFDLLIGASAIFSNMTLVTANIKHFENMPGIKVVNWKS